MREVCADCGRSDPSWASLNRGILLCQECCRVHRSMGRQISWVRSLQQGWWSPSLLKMVETLSTSGANSVWEYSLMDQTTSPSCKPSSTEPQHGTKEEFIRAKHEELQYIARSNGGDGDGPDGAGAQLHAAARTSDLLTSLRLFSQGADPNFFHEEKGSCPLHVAAKANQPLQAELLMIYGADLNRKDSAGRTPEDVARDSGNLSLGDRLRTARFHVFDHLIQYLCSRHSGSLLDDLGLDGSENHEGRSKLETLTNTQFEKLVADVYDEVDRREAGAAWRGPAPTTPDPTPFLPPHSELSATRNQARQKLGRVPPSALEQLIRDVVREARRRDVSILKGKQPPGQNSSPVGSLKPRPEISDDEPLYDSVASDDDYASTNSGELLLSAGQSQPATMTTVQSQPSAITSVQPQPSVINQSAVQDEEIRNSLVASEATILKLQAEIRLLQNQVSDLINENRELRDEVTRSRSYPRSVEMLRDSDQTLSSDKTRTMRPTSMYETRDRNYNSLRSSPLRSPVWPEYPEVMARTEKVTKTIQELCSSMKMLDYDALPSSAANIRTVVTQLTSIFPQTPPDEIIRELTSHARQLEVECACAASEALPARERSLHNIRDLAYNIAKGTKQLVLRTSNPT